MRFLTLRELDSSEGTVQLREATSLSSTRGARIDYPAPSPTDPNDPLRWPRWKKHAAFVSVCAFTFLTNFAIGGLAPAFPVISNEFHKSMGQTSELLLWPILVLGVFNFFWVPLANYLGKRPVFVVASLLLTVSYLWGAVSGSFKSLLWSNVIAAFAGSSSEALGAAIVNDLYFLHERGAKMGWYMAAISAGNTIGPLICGSVVQGLGWRWHKWIAGILTGVNFLAVCMLVPETTYVRETARKLKTGCDLAVKRNDSLPLRSGISTSPDNEVPKEQGLTALPHVELTSIGSKESIQKKRKSFVSGLSLSSEHTMKGSLGHMAIRPFPLIIHPAIIFAFLGYAVSLAWVVAVNVLNPFVLQAPPYTWSPQKNGLINVPGFFGNIVGAFIGGWVSDRYCDRRTRSMGGIYQPEDRLILLGPPSIVTIVGCLVFGFGVERALHWITLFVGYGMISVALTAIPTITMTYVSDAVLPVNADALLLVNGLKNVVAFGFLYGIVPWVETVGYATCFGTQAALFAGLVGIGALVFIVFGKRIRHAAAQWRIIIT